MRHAREAFGGKFDLAAERAVILTGGSRP